MPRGSKEFNERDRDVKTTAEQAAIEQKSGVGSVVSVDEDDDGESTITALVSATGVVDNVQDVIVPGAYEKTLKAREPQPGWSHRWEEPIGATLDVKELMPGDPLLAEEKLPDGSPWPAEAGALMVKMVANRSTDVGERAYQNIKFANKYRKGGSPWSIGYRASRATRDSKTGIRHIKELDLFEYSPVLHGANSHAKTLTVKSMNEALTALEMGGYDTSELPIPESKSADVEPDAEGLSPAEVKELVAAADLLDAYLSEIGVKRATVVEGDPDLELPDDDERWVDSDEDESPMSLYDELEQLLDPDDFADLLELAAEFDDASDEGDPDAAGEVMSELLDVFEAEEAEDEELTALRDVIADVLEDRWPEAAGEDDEDDDDELAEDDDAYYDESEEDESEDEGDADEVDDSAEDAGDAGAGEKSAYWVKEIPKSKRDEMAKRGTALRDGSFPIADASHLRSAIRLRTQGNAPNKVVDDHIKKRANALNLSHMLPDSMTAGNKKKPSEKSLPLSEVKALPSLSWGSEEVGSLVVDAIQF